MHPVDHDLPRGGVIEAAQKIQQGALARAARAGHGNELTPGDLQGNRVEGGDGRGAIGAGGFDETDHAVHK